MATAVKTAVTFQASASNAAGATTTGSSVDLTTAFGAILTAKITNGATGPTVAASFTTEISHDNSAWKIYSKQTAGVTNSAVYEFTVDLPPAVPYARSKFSENTGQACTVESLATKLTSIG